MKKKFIVIFGLVCLAILLFFVFKNDNMQVMHDKNTARVSDTTASVSDSAAPKTKIKYRILEFNGDTTVWDSADCVIRDSSFSCSMRIVQNDFRDLLINKKTTLNSPPKANIVYKDLNFGKDAIVNYIPIANIPAFDRNNVAKFFSHLSGGPCSKLLTFRSNYKIETIELPDFFKWVTTKKWEKRNEQDMFIHKNTTGQNVCFHAPSSKLPKIHAILETNYDQRTFSTIYLPQKKEIHEYKLLNYSLLYKDTTFSWKLVYKDQYGRGDTLDITTKFKATPNYTPAKCYDSAIEKGSTKDTLFYRILDFRGDTTIWHPSDCKIFGDFFSCVRIVSAPAGNLYRVFAYEGNLYRVSAHERDLYRVSTHEGKQCNYPYYKKHYANATYKDLNFGKEAITNYIPVANIPEFNRDSVAKLFSILPSTSCSALLTFKSNYSIEPIGLPNDFEWRRDFPKAVVKEISKKKKMCALEYRSLSNRPDPYKKYRDIVFEELPEKARIYSYQLFNKSLQSYKDSTITWKLVYKDQYGRGDTLDITTKFE